MSCCSVLIDFGIRFGWFHVSSKSMDVFWSVAPASVASVGVRYQFHSVGVRYQFHSVGVRYQLPWEGAVQLAQLEQRSVAARP